MVIKKFERKLLKDKKENGVDNGFGDVYCFVFYLINLYLYFLKMFFE